MFNGQRKDTALRRGETIRPILGNGKGGGANFTTEPLTRPERQGRGPIFGAQKK